MSEGKSQPRTGVHAEASTPPLSLPPSSSRADKARSLFVPKFACGLIPEPFTRRLRRYMAVAVEQRFQHLVERVDLSLVLAVDASASMGGRFDEARSPAGRLICFLLMLGCPSPTLTWRGKGQQEQRREGWLAGTPVERYANFAR